MKKLFAILFLLGISYVGMSQSKYIVVGEENAGKENVQQKQILYRCRFNGGSV